MGHRRWIIGNWNSGIGIGSASSYSCMVVGGAFGGSGPVWSAWPPPGIMPIQAMQASWQGVDSTGWTIQSDSISFGSATVTITENSVSKTVTTAVLQPNYGSYNALRISPDGWSSTAGSTYSVEISGISSPIQYEVEMVDCDQYP